MIPLDQVWYWGNIDKNTVSQALSTQNDGAFIVRNASTPGDYTLSIRCNNQVKLVKIHVVNDKCGFSLDSLTYPSIVSLINYHRTASLKSYNEQLDVTLSYPVPRPSALFSIESPVPRKDGNSSRSSVQSAPSPNTVPNIHQTDPEWSRQLSLERLRIAEANVERCTKLYDAVNFESTRADAVFTVLVKSVDDIQTKMVKLQEISRTQSACIEEEPESQKIEVLKANKQIVDKTIAKLKEEKDIVVSQRARLSTIIEEMKEELKLAKTRLSKSQETRKIAYSQMHDDFCPIEFSPTKSQVIEMIGKESMKVSQLLGDLDLPWDPSQYLINDASKEATGSLIMLARTKSLAERKKTEGIFLIRPSATKHGKLVLSVLNGERISHCLIEQNEQGWGFENGGLYFVTIGDFVRYYAQASLEEHNKDIKTNLTQPAL
ncbi:unnamed protein product [Auanema sp. JU1783]|nr:unnamed protein product [Auanema sp. JU1783]